MKELNEINLIDLIEQETGEKFNRTGYIKCPFHIEKTPSMSVKFFPNINKQRYKCWGCDSSGDAIDFIKKYKNVEYNEARKYLGLEVENSPTESFEEKINKFVQNQVKNGNKKGYKPVGIFTFVDENNVPIYSKVKLIKLDGKKETPYYHIENEQVICNRGHEEVPYNYYNLKKGISEKIVVIVEGEKDVNTLSHMLSKSKYVVTSLKGFSDFEKIKNKNMKIYVLGDTGESGKKYIENIKYNFLNICSSFKIINLQGIQKLGDNKDVTDWLKSGHTKEELLNCFERSLDQKDINELQQDGRGIYYLKYSKLKEDYEKEYITNFNVIEASKINKIDANLQGIKVKLKSCIDNKVEEKVGESKIFDDIRAFRNFLGMDFSFTGKNTNEVVRLKDWINKYFALDSEELHDGAKFLPIDDKFQLITSKGALQSNSENYCIKAEQTKIDMFEIEEINRNELQELMKNLFDFCEYSKALSIIGSAISFLQVGQSIESNEKLHHLLIVGESGSGKSTILERVVAPILNYPKEEKKAISTTTFATQKIVSTGNYPVIFDEFKPSMMDQRKMQNLSDLLRNAYDRATINKGNKSLEMKEYKLTRPLVIAGEESYPYSEKALITRSCIVYISKHERSEENTKAMNYLIENEKLLNKLGKSLILQVLKLKVEEYKSLRIELKKVFSNLKDRPQNTAINIACGIELLNKVLIKNDLSPISNYYSHIESNIRNEVLDNGEDAYSEVEKMLIIYNDMIQNNNHFVSDEAVSIEKYKNGQVKLYIRTQLIIDAIFKYCNEVKEIDIKTLLNSRDFKKQAKKSGYIKNANAKQIRIGVYQNFKGRPSWFDEYDADLLRKLKIDGIIEFESWKNSTNIIEANFQK